MRGQPIVSIALPVHNGAEYLAAALESILAQTLPEFELVIVDNASTDSTAEIAARFANADPRVRVHRNDSNIGAAPNFNLGFDITTAPYFKWAAHDDLCDPRFLETCVAVLDTNAEAVLAYPRTRIIGARCEVIEDYELELPTDDSDPAVRYRSLLIGHKCFEVFGLIRRDALMKTGLIGSFAHGDGILLAQLALRGTFVKVPEPLFLARRHGDQSMEMIGDPWSYAEWFAGENAGSWVFPHWRIYGEFLKAVFSAPVSISERRACLRALGAIVWQRKRLLSGDIMFHVRRIARAWGLPVPG